MPDAAELKAYANIQRWRASPATMVRELFHVQPDPWQEEALELYPKCPRLALKASKGPGKTACLSWIAWNFLLTRPQPKVLATSISGDNLADGMWTEMDKWRGKSPLLQKHFEWTKTRIYHKGQYETTWWMAARQWSQSADKSQQANTLAGMHADYILFLLDESGGIPDPVMVTAEAALSSCVEGHIVQAGNPTHLSGPLYRAVNLERALWKVVEISGDPDDPKRSTRISMQWAQDMIKTWGREHPYVLVNVLGRFPPSSFNALIGPDEVRDAQKRFYRDFEIGNAPKVLGVDVALFGDDQSVIAFRQGLQMLNFKKYRNLQPSMGASIVSREWEEYGAVAAFVDATGGAGSGWVDGLMLLGRAPIGVQFSGHAHENQRYANKRAEMYFDAVAWIKRGGALPPDDNLLAQLTATTYTYEKRGDRFLIEPKEMVKAKLNGNSPDEADAFCLVEQTLIRTTDGDKPIEDIQQGDLVLTPLGTARVMKKWITQTDRLTTAEFSNGKQLVGRPEHKIFVYKCGITRLDALSFRMVVSTWEERHKWLRMSALFTTIRSIGFKKAVDILAPEKPSSAKGYCIAVFGRSAMDQFQKVSRSIIRMVTGAISQLVISRHFQPQTITLCTQPNAASLPNSKSATTAISHWLRKKQKYGIQARKVWNGINKMELIAGKIESPGDLLARNAELNSQPIGQGHDIVQNLADRGDLINAIRRSLPHALGAVRRLWPIATTRHPVVPVHVQTESVPPTTVYNLTLDRDNAYYANGILVFNCLTFAEPVTAQDAKGRPRFTSNYNPFDEVNKSTGMSATGKFLSHYDPFASS